MYIKIEDYTEDAIAKLVKYSGVCYGKDTERENPSGMIKKLMDMKHLSVLRFAYATVKIGEISRVCSHELVRIAHFGILQQSGRFTEQKEGAFVKPDIIPQEIFDNVINTCYTTYKYLLDNQYPKQIARYVLPEATQTQLYMSANFQAWLHFLNLRCPVGVQQETRDVALTIFMHFNQLWPEIFNHDTVITNKHIGDNNVS